VLVALIALQLAGLAGLYLVLRRRIDRTLHGRDEVPELRTRVAELIAEMNGTAERNVTLLEDRIRCLDELLREADRRASRDSPEGLQHAPAPAHGAGGGERETQVRRLRRLGFSSAVIADRLATSQGEVELILNLAADRGPVRHRSDAGRAAPPATRA
jgi:DNA-binding NarL/FixJ family response regulator